MRYDEMILSKTLAKFKPPEIWRKSFYPGGEQEDGFKVKPVGFSRENELSLGAVLGREEGEALNYVVMQGLLGGMGSREIIGANNEVSKRKALLFCNFWFQQDPYSLHSYWNCL